MSIWGAGLGLRQHSPLFSQAWLFLVPLQDTRTRRHHKWDFSLLRYDLFWSSCLPPASGLFPFLFFVMLGQEKGDGGSRRAHVEFIKGNLWIIHPRKMSSYVQLIHPFERQMGDSVVPHRSNRILIVRYGKQHKKSFVDLPDLEDLGGHTPWLYFMPTDVCLGFHYLWHVGSQNPNWAWRHLKTRMDSATRGPCLD